MKKKLLPWRWSEKNYCSCPCFVLCCVWCL